MIGLLLAALLAAPARAETEYCAIRLDRLSVQAAPAGTELELIGQWGSSRGNKLPCVNSNGQNVLQVVSWSETVIKARIPPELSAGKYRVGVYCRPPEEGSTQSSGFTDFEITEGAPVAASSWLTRLLEGPWASDARRVLRRLFNKP